MPSPLLLATRSTFEALALLFAAPSPAPAAAAEARAALGAGAVGMRVAFAAPDGAARGVLHVAVSAGVADALAENMLGAAPNDDAAHADASRRDATGELANVITGNVLPLAAGREAVFHLAAPTLVPVDVVIAAYAAACAAPSEHAPSEHAPSEHAASEHAWCEWLDVEGGRAAVALVLDPASAVPDRAPDVVPDAVPDVVPDVTPNAAPRPRGERAA